ncbi:FK506-binding protein [Planctomycetes bacterium Pla163]|uniref:Peptidyl-prolyl cis-trans isomerase n=1 Tax=Rohdeia mirabilis TaxID=2528008 RepID=A0A518D1B1_9BACT|nr:FK506-binding protein [Planctomycetes bacterium Pla163]
MNTIKTLLGLAVLTAGLAGCQGSSDEATNAGAAPSSATEASDASTPGAGSTDANSTDAAPTKDDSAAQKQWAAGDTIPSGRAGVPDIEILEVHGNGSGEVCGTGRRATLAYKAMLINGQVLDPGTVPFTFQVGAREAIQGWDIIVAKMRVGDSFTLTIPQQLAYGPSRGDLKFDMELLSFE